MVFYVICQCATNTGFVVNEQWCHRLAFLVYGSILEVIHIQNQQLKWIDWNNIFPGCISHFSRLAAQTVNTHTRCNFTARGYWPTKSNWLIVLTNENIQFRTNISLSIKRKISSQISNISFQIYYFAMRW